MRARRARGILRLRAYIIYFENILLRVGDKWSDDWIKRVYIDDDGDWRFDICDHALDAKAFNDLGEVNAFLGGLPLNKVFIFVSKHNPITRHIIGEGYIKTK